jgi:hypothetical protein
MQITPLKTSPELSKPETKTNEPLTDQLIEGALAALANIAKVKKKLPSFSPLNPEGASQLFGNALGNIAKTIGRSFGPWV